MSLGYRAVGWNRQKRIYDTVLVGGVLGFLACYVAVASLVNGNATVETHLIRSFGAAAFFLLHVVLAIGPLARLDARWLPLLYNRRHMGVTMFLLALVHGAFSLVQFHALGNVQPLVSLFTSNMRYDSLAWFPFQPLGFFALGILFLMAATSHDFWLANLGPRAWKSLHMSVYWAYALIVGHVLLGALQAERSPVLAVLVGIGLVTILTLHLVAGRREERRDEDRVLDQAARWVDVGAPDEIPEGCAKTVNLAGERVAVFRYDDCISVVSNVCRHQNGPLGEGRILEGCITCPWHGYQYRPQDGTSPPPFEEKVETYAVSVIAGRILVDPRAKPPGTPVEPARIGDGRDGGDEA